jgi:hypothetical protein
MTGTRSIGYDERVRGASGSLTITSIDQAFATVATPIAFSCMSFRPGAWTVRVRTPSVTVSLAPGELIDEITIFEIKAKRITGSDSGRRSSKRGRTPRRRPRCARRKTGPVPIRRGRHDHLFSPWSPFQSASFGSSSASSSTPVRGTTVNRQDHRHDVPHGDIP